MENFERRDETNDEGRRGDGGKRDMKTGEETKQQEERKNRRRK